MKAEILLKTFLAQDHLQDVYAKEETDKNILYDIRTFNKLALWQAINTHWGMFMMSAPYHCKEHYD